MNPPILIFVLYDGIDNSVFQGQVLKPLMDKLNSNEFNKIVLISFENKPCAHERVDEINHNNRLELVVLKKLPFLGTISLHYAARQLKKVLQPFPSYHLVARGPLAGFISVHAITKTACESVTIQARGLLAAEYAYTHKNETNIIKKLVHRVRTWQCASVEKQVYQNVERKNGKKIVVESVSTALKAYLINTYKANPATITIAHHDIPTLFPATQITTWKTAMRSKLAIPPDAHVYCYNGSAKPWQCPEKTIQFFAKKLQENPKSFLLVLTQDTAAFETLINQHALPTPHYKILSVAHHDIFPHLAACDTGLIFREQNILNWVSRPTKILEYWAIGLKIEHNGTIGLMSEKPYQQG